MAKTLRAQKNIETKTFARLSSSVKKTIYENVSFQYMATVRIPSEYNDICDDIRHSSFLMLRTAHRLEEYSKIVSGFKSELKVKELGNVLSILCEKAAPFFKKRGLLLVPKISSEKIFVNIDEERFYYVVLEILLNAIEYSKPNSRVYLILSCTQKYAKLEIKDKGVGMTEEVRINALEPFFTTKEGRSGLGLTLVNSFAKELRGRLSVSSQPGKNTVITLFLPKTQPETTRVESPNIEIVSSKVSPVEIMLD